MKTWRQSENFFVHSSSPDSIHNLSCFPKCYYYIIYFEVAGPVFIGFCSFLTNKRNSSSLSNRLFTFFNSEKYYIFLEVFFALCCLLWWFYVSCFQLFRPDIKKHFVGVCGSQKHDLLFTNVSKNIFLSSPAGWGYWLPCRRRSRKGGPLCNLKGIFWKQPSFFTLKLHLLQLLRILLFICFAALNRFVLFTCNR